MTQNFIPSLNDTLAGKTFGGLIQSAFSAGQLAHVQLFNPAASGKTLFVVKVVVFVTTGFNFRIGGLATALTTASGASGNLKLGGSGPVAQLRRQSNAGSLGSAFWAAPVLANTHLDFDFSLTPIAIAENNGLLLRSDTVDVNFDANFIWIER